MAEGIVAQAHGLARKHEEKLRFLVVGVWNTVFATGLLWVLEHLMRPEGVVQKQLVLTLVWVIAVTQNFFTFKLLVFRTKGHWLREYAKMYVTYSATFVVQSLLIQLISGYFGVSLFIANIPVLFVITIMSYLGHKYFTFRHVVEAVDAGETFEDSAEEPVPED